VKISLSGDQLLFFDRYGYLELEGVFSEKHVIELLESVEEILYKRAYPIKGSVLKYGHNLTLASETIQKRLCSPSMGKMLYSMTKTRPIRYGFDQILFAPYPPKGTTLKELSSLSSVLIGAIIAFDDIERFEESEAQPFVLKDLPTSSGSICFISPETVLELDISGRYLLVVYCGSEPIYIYQEKDPYTHAFKEYGYVFGDRLLEKTNPIVSR
jgi:hypothetical protein